MRTEIMSERFSKLLRNTIFKIFENLLVNDFTKRKRERDKNEILTMDSVLELQLLLLYVLIHVHGLRSRIELSEERVRRYLRRRTELVVLREFDCGVCGNDTVCVCD